MQPYAYVEILLLDNFLITLVLFLFSSAILKLKLHKCFLIFACLFSSIINLAVPYFNLSGLLNVIFKLSLGLVLCFICCFKNKIKEQIKFYLMFLISTCLFGGIFFFVYYSLMIPLKIDFIPIGLFALVVFVLGKILFKALNSFSQPYFNDCSYFCELYVNSKKIKLNAYLDTGNLLVDKVGQLPVVVVQLQTIQSLFDNDELYSILNGNFSEINLKDIHSINYSTIEGKNKTLTIFTPDKFIINNKMQKKEVKCAVGISPLPLFSNKNFQAIIGLNIIQGGVK